MIFFDKESTFKGTVSVTPLPVNNNDVIRLEDIQELMALSDSESCIKIEFSDSLNLNDSFYGFMNFNSKMGSSSTKVDVFSNMGDKVDFSVSDYSDKSVQFSLFFSDIFANMYYKLYFYEKDTTSLQIRSGVDSIIKSVKVKNLPYFEEFLLNALNFDSSPIESYKVYGKNNIKTFEGFFATSSIKEFSVPLYNSSISFFETFLNCSSLETVDIRNSFNITNFDKCFLGCSKLKTIKSVLDVKNLVYLNGTFDGCTSLEEVKIKNLSTSIDLHNTIITEENAEFLIKNALTAEKESITFPSYLSNLLSTEIKSLAQSKGYSVDFV